MNREPDTVVSVTLVVVMSKSHESSVPVVPGVPSVISMRHVPSVSASLGNVRLNDCDDRIGKINRIRPITSWVANPE